jgi:hypothetical protein
MRMRVFAAAAVIASIVGSGCAYAQSPSVPKYGEEEKAKSPSQIEADKAAQKAYERSLGNIPDKGTADPWGNVRSDSSPKPAAKAAPVKRAKTGNAAN